MEIKEISTQVSIQQMVQEWNLQLATAS